MARTLLAPQGVTSANHLGEEYRVDKDGQVSVPDALAAILTNSHGFRHLGEGRAAARDVRRSKRVEVGQATTIADDDEAITDDEAPPPHEYPSPSEFTAGLTQARMKQFLRSEGIPIPRTGTVR